MPEEIWSGHVGLLALVVQFLVHKDFHFLPSDLCCLKHMRVCTTWKCTLGDRWEAAQAQDCETTVRSRWVLRMEECEGESEGMLVLSASKLEVSQRLRFQGEKKGGW